ncbi:MAG: DUF302 domain-containing protein [Steroidobacteraceae bacterium]|jgi:uncharacterized protein (DUF302 family)
MTDTQASDIVEHVSPLPFDRTVERLLAAIAKGGLTVFARIDHAANARAAGAAMPPATVLIYGNAKGGTPIMLVTPRAALDLPLRALVQERTDGKVVVAFHPVTAMLRQTGVPADAAARLEPAQRMLVEAIES